MAEVTGPLTSKVYVFNCMREQTDTVRVNNRDAAAILGWSQGGTGQPTKYTPNALPVARSRDKQDPATAFAIGDNDLYVPWQSFVGTATVTVPKGEDVPLVDDLLLFINKSAATLTTIDGYTKGTFLFTIKPSS